MSKSISRRLADKARAAGYAVEEAYHWAGTRRHAYRVLVAWPETPGHSVSLPYHHIGRAEQGTACWVEIAPGGHVHIAGPGYSSGRQYPSTLAGIEAARIAILAARIEHIVANMREWGSNTPEVLASGQRAITGILRLMAPPAAKI